jgi:nucleoside-diphosphate-sugar epimerase
MRIFLTGASGYIGNAVLEALVRGGHDVAGLVRNGERAAAVQARGGRPVIGTLAEPAVWQAAAEAADGVIHTAFEDSVRGPELDGVAIDTLLAPVRGRRRRFVIYTSGVWVLGDTSGPAAEDAPVRPTPYVAWRPAHEQRVLDAGSRTLRTAIVRPGIVYGGSRGIVADLVRDAQNGLMRVIGAGENHWPLVHERDLGELYLKIAATADASGVFHATDEGDERVNDVVAAIAAAVPLKPDVRRVPLPEARKKLGPYADALVLDQIVRSPRARALGWAPAVRSVAGNAPRLVEEWRRGREAA